MNHGVVELRPAPPLLLGAGLLTWGWQNEFLIYAIIMAILLEMAHWIDWRWPMPDKEFNQLTDLSGVGFFIAVLYIFFNEGSKGIFIILSILPFVFFLLILTQLYSEQGKIKLSALFVSLRRLETGKLQELNKSVDISLPYFLICLIAASAGNQRTIWFFIIVCLLIAVLLGALRPRRYHIISWLSVLILACSLAYTGQIGIRNIQFAIERSMMRIFDQFMWRYRDPSRTTTAIGTIGRLKVSDRVLLRIKTDEKLTEPLYLREATYNSYSYGVWSAVDSIFNTIDVDPTGDSWTINDTTPDKELSIATYMIKEVGVIPLPHGTNKVKGAGIVEISKNNYNTVNMDIREGWIRYGANHQAGKIFDREPDDNDLHVSGTYQDDFKRLANELELYDKSPEQIIRIVKQHFAENFFYTLTRKQQFPRGKYLADFLFNSRKGHCEFFATSTVLLLRTVGIPARYTVGYSIHEYSTLERQYIARSRHAHSWVLTYVNDQWQRIDTTPSVWAPLEEDNASTLQPLFDLMGWINYKYSRWQSKDELEDEETTLDLLWLLIPLVLILTWRLYFKERIKKTKSANKTHKKQTCPGMDSSFYHLVEFLEQAGFRRQHGETMTTWLMRIDHGLSDDKIKQALALHYQYRFDPKGVSKQIKDRLNILVTEILSDLKPQHS